jgi:uncharacterized protein (TIGR03083 family)
MSVVEGPELGFGEMLELIDDRSAALRTAAAQAGMDARVPGCREWSVRDLIAHLGDVHLGWAAIVAAGPADQPPPAEALGDTQPRGDVFQWAFAATDRLVSALREAGPERGCWTWWASSGAPMTAGAVARHQVQEAAVHAFDAEQAAGGGSGLPPRAAADGVGEHLTVELPTNGPWPHEPAAVRLESGEGGTWLVRLGPDGASSSRLTPGEAASVPVAATVTADPSDLVLAFYRRQPHAEPLVTGDRLVYERLLAWPNLD